MVWALLIALAVLLFVLLTVFPALKMRRRIAALQEQNDRIRKNGTPATAEVLSFAETGIGHREGPVVRLTVRVTPAEGNPHEAEVRAVVPNHRLSAMQPGATVPVRVHGHRAALDLASDQEGQDS